MQAAGEHSSQRATPATGTVQPATAQGSAGEPAVSPAGEASEESARTTQELRRPSKSASHTGVQMTPFTLHPNPTFRLPHGCADRFCAVLLWHSMSSG